MLVHADFVPDLFGNHIVSFPTRRLIFHCFIYKHIAVCGRKLYDSEIDICCDGAVIHGGALGRWGCCGKAPLALSRELCCNGTIQFVYNVETTDKQCCGSDLLDPAEGICCYNQTFLGHTWCPGSFYGTTVLFGY